MSKNEIIGCVLVVASGTLNYCYANGLIKYKGKPIDLNSELWWPILGIVALLAITGFALLS